MSELTCVLNSVGSVSHPFVLASRSNQSTIIWPVISIILFLTILVFGAVILAMRIKDKANQEIDRLTGLSNLKGFYRRSEKLVRANPDTRFVILRSNILRFRMINSMFGENVADQLLIDISKILKDTCLAKTANYCVGRVGADDFLVILPKECFSKKDFDREVIDKIEHVLPNFIVKIQFGIYEIVDDNESWTKRCDNAKEAAHAIKRDNTQRWASYDSSMQIQKNEEDIILSSMKAGIENREFQVYYQPQYDYSTGNICGAEALVRWNHPKLGFISPGRFIPIFEENGFIYEVDKYVWDTAASDIKRLREKGITVPQISVNISRGDVFRPDITDFFKNLLEKYSLSPKDIHIEITETAYIETPEYMRIFMEKMHKYGFLIEMDDFGSGYSSLNSLKKTDFDLIKLDMGFLQDYGDSDKTGSILTSTVHMIHQLRLPIIAEGVESNMQAEFLKSIGCIYMQGYYFHKPVPCDKLEELLVQKVPVIADKKQFAENVYEDFLNINNRESILFTRFSNGAAVIERTRGISNIVRTNDKFYTELDIPRNIWGEDDNRLDNMLLPDSYETVCSLLDRAISENTEVIGAIKCLNGQKKKLAIEVNVIYLGANGDSQFFYFGVMNITAQEEIKRKNKIFQVQKAIENGVSDINKYICYFDIAEKVFTVPKTYAQKHGIPESEADFKISTSKLGMQICDDTSRAMFDSFFTCIIAGATNLSSEIEFKLPDGKTIWEKAEAITIYDDDGTAVKTVIVVEDITESRNEAAEKEERISSIEAEVATYTFIKEQLSILRNETNHERGISNVLQAIGEYTGADKTYIYEYDDGAYHQRYRCGGNDDSDSSEELIIPVELTETVKNVFEEGERVTIENVDSLSASKAKLSEFFKKCGISSFIGYPIMNDGKLEAFIGLTNPDKNKINAISTILLIISHTLYDLLIEEKKLQLSQKQIETTYANSEMSAAIFSLYFCIWTVDLVNRRVRVFDNGVHDNSMRMLTDDSISTAFGEIINNHANPGYREQLERFFDIDAITEKLKENSTASTEYESIVSGRIRIDAFVPNSSENEDIKQIFLAFKHVQSAVVSSGNTSVSSNKVFDASYGSVIECNITRNTHKWLTLPPADMKCEGMFTELFEGCVSQLAENEEKYEFISKFSREGLLEFWNSEYYSISQKYCTIGENGETHWMEIVGHKEPDSVSGGGDVIYLLSVQCTDEYRHSEEILKNTVSRLTEIQKIFTGNCFGYFEFNLSKNQTVGNIIQNINGKSVEVNNVFGMRFPCKISDLGNVICSFCQPVDTDNLHKYFDCWYLIGEYEKGNVSISYRYWFYDEQQNKINIRQSYYLMRDETTGDVTGVTTLHIEDASVVNNEANEIVDTHLADVLNEASMGTWSVEVDDGKAPRMYADDTMRKLLGIYSDEYTPEQIYAIWIEKIHPDDAEKVHKYQLDMISFKHPKVTYLWNHPKYGFVYVLCGGFRDINYSENGIKLIGYHQIVDEAVRHEMKLLKELEVTVDKYRKADRDMRKDFLTGLYNRFDMFEFLNKPDTGEKISAVFMLDIDNYKSYNDKYGHVAGDKCLVRVGSALKQYGAENHIRFYRYGGEEVIGFLLDPERDARTTADELVNLIRDLDIKRDDTPYKCVTISLGFTTNITELDAVVDYADKAMYTAKESGKNRCVCYEDLSK